MQDRDAYLNKKGASQNLDKFSSFLKDKRIFLLVNPMSRDYFFKKYENNSFTCSGYVDIFSSPFRCLTRV